MRLGENDVQSIRADLGEVKTSLANLTEAVADLRVLVAGEYVKKADFDECKKCSEERIVRVYDKIEENKKEEASNRWKLAGLVFTVSAFVFSLLQWAFNFSKNFKGGTQ